MNVALSEVWAKGGEGGIALAEEVIRLQGLGHTNGHLVEAKSGQLLNLLLGVGGEEKVIRLCEQPNDFTFAYELDDTIENKITAIVQKIYGGKDVLFTANALGIPFSRASRFSLPRSALATPPLYLRARIVATITTALGFRPRALWPPS